MCEIEISHISAFERKNAHLEFDILLLVVVFDISMWNIDCRYIDVDIDKDNLENIDIGINIDKAILENIVIDIDKDNLENINIDTDKDIL